MIIPELPDYLTGLGGEDYKGLIIALFTATAGLSRPFSGKLADTIGRIPVMVIGAIVCVVSGLLYPIASTVFSFLLLRFFHGFSTGFKPTGTSAYISDIVPFDRRGEGLGIQGVSAGIGMGLGPAIGSVVANWYGIDFMFYCSAFFAFLSVAVLIGMKETVANRQKFGLGLLKINRSDIFEPRVLPPSIVLLLCAFSFGVVLTLIPDLSKYLGIQNKGLFFTYFTIASISVRFFAGKASDIYGRLIILVFSTATLAIAMIIIGFSTSPFPFFFGAVLLGLGSGMNTPTIFAWTIDLSNENHRGRAMATMYIALEAGIGIGALVSGSLYSNNPEMFGLVFSIAAFLCIAAFGYLITQYFPRISGST